MNKVNTMKQPSLTKYEQCYVQRQEATSKIMQAASPNQNFDINMLTSRIEFLLQSSLTSFVNLKSSIIIPYTFTILLVLL